MPATDDAQHARARSAATLGESFLTGARGDGFFSAVSHFHQCGCLLAFACHLLGPKRTLPPQYDKVGTSFCTARECDRPETSQQNFRGANS
jgi:hypothetical protein